MPNLEFQNKNDAAKIITGNTSDEVTFVNYDVEYWKKRCELAEKFIEESPSDPDITEKQRIAFRDWQEIKRMEEYMDDAIVVVNGSAGSTSWVKTEEDRIFGDVVIKAPIPDVNFDQMHKELPHIKFSVDPS